MKQILIRLIRALQAEGGLSVLRSAMDDRGYVLLIFVNRYSVINSVNDAEGEVIKLVGSTNPPKHQKISNRGFILNNFGEEFVPRRDPDPRYIFSEASWKILSEKVKHTSNDF
jgi:hypothetical protein